VAVSLGDSYGVSATNTKNLASRFKAPLTEDVKIFRQNFSFFTVLSLEKKQVNSYLS